LSISRVVVQPPSRSTADRKAPKVGFIRTSNRQWMPSDFQYWQARQARQGGGGEFIGGRRPCHPPHRPRPWLFRPLKSGCVPSIRREGPDVLERTWGPYP